jgi:hypothetical protein
MVGLYVEGIEQYEDGEALEIVSCPSNTYHAAVIPTPAMPTIRITPSFFFSWRSSTNSQTRPLEAKLTVDLEERVQIAGKTRSMIDT